VVRHNPRQHIVLEACDPVCLLLGLPYQVISLARRFPRQLLRACSKEAISSFSSLARRSSILFCGFKPGMRRLLCLLERLLDLLFHANDFPQNIVVHSYILSNNDARELLTIACNILFILCNSHP